MSSFLGRYEYQMDEKGRVSLPSAFRKEAEGDRFVLLQWEEAYLTLFPESAWKGVQSRLLEYRRSGSDGWAYIRRITSSAVEVSPDKQGRILIPSWLQESAGLSGAVLVIGALDRIEIWDPERFGSSLERGAGDFETFAPKIFG